MQILQVEQGTQAWLDARCGIITCSRLNDVMASGRGNAESKTRRRYMLELIGERLTGVPCPAFQGNEHTQRGTDHEPIARAAYEIREFVDVQQVGFVLNHGIGYSPDGFVGDNGLIEIKSKAPHILLDVLLSDSVPSEHVKQIQGGLWVAEREWLDFVAFWPALPLFVKRVYRDEKLISEIASACSQFYAEMDELIFKLKEAA